MDREREYIKRRCREVAKDGGHLRTAPTDAAIVLDVIARLEAKLRRAEQAGAAAIEVCKDLHGKIAELEAKLERLTKAAEKACEERGYWTTFARGAEAARDALDRLSGAVHQNANPELTEQIQKAKQGEQDG